MEFPLFYMRMLKKQGTKEKISAVVLEGSLIDKNYRGGV